jgi:hypothetical protein
MSWKRIPWGAFVSVVVLAAHAAFAAPPIVCGGVSFSPLPQVNDIGYVTGITVADVDADGHPDLVIGNLITDTVDIRYGDGHGGFSAPTSLSFPNLYNNDSTLWPVAPKVADLNGDGRPDLVVAFENADQIGVRLGQAGGGFGPPTNYFMDIGSAVGPQDLALVDLNHDGHLDVITIDRVNASGIVIRLGNASGGFGGIGGKALGFDEDLAGFAVGDINGDGTPDVVAYSTSSPAHGYGAGFAAFLGDGSGGLGNEIFMSSVGNPPALADVNGDGLADLLYVEGGALRVRLSHGDGTFESISSSQATAAGPGIQVADFNGDGRLDALVAGSGTYYGSSANIDILLGDGTGQFGPPLTIATADPLVGIPAVGFGDLDGDGRLDLVGGTSHFVDFDTAVGALLPFQNTCAPGAPPTIVPSAAITRQIGSPASPSTVATLSDDHTAAADVTVSVRDVPDGLTVTAPVNANGRVTAAIGAVCDATAGPASFTLRATDEDGLFSDATIPLTLLADAAPTLGAYPTTSVGADDSLLIAPLNPPADNGRVDTMSVTAAGFTGTLSVNLDTGVVTVVHAAPAGTYTVVVTARDNCGLETQQSFTLKVRARATLQLGNLAAVYDGQAHFASVVTSPPGLAGVSLTYTQGTTPVAAPTQAGSYLVTASLTNDDYDADPVTGTLTIAQASPVLVWVPPAGIVYGTPLTGAQLNASANVPGTIVYTPGAGTVLSAGTQVLTATFTPSDSIDYTTATAAVPLTVAQAVPVLTWPQPAGIAFGTPLGDAQLDAVANVPGVFTYTPPAGTVLGAGTQVLSVTFTPTDSIDYTTATATVTLHVAPAVARFVAFSVEGTWLQPDAVVSTGDIGANQDVARRSSRDDHGGPGSWHDDDRPGHRALWQWLLDPRDSHGWMAADGHNQDATVRLDPGVTLLQPGSRVVGTTVRLSNRASVYDVVDNVLIDRHATILGSVTSPMPQVPFLALPAFPTVQAGHNDQRVRHGRTATLAPGRYGDIRVEQGATLVLTGGLYEVASLDLDNGAAVIARGATEIRIERELDAGAGSRLMPDQTVAGLGAADLVVYVAGDDDSCRHTPIPDLDGDNAGRTSVHIGPHSLVRANVYAARGTVWLKSGTQATGSFIGVRVRIGQRVTLRLESAFN